MNTNTVKKVCSTCKNELGVEHFHKNKTKRDGLATSCKPCFKQISKQHYEQNKQSYFDRNQRVRRRQKEEQLIFKKNTPCTDCGQKYHPVAMEFDHIDPAGKVFAIGRSGSRSDKQLREEMEKCELVCSNCHKVRTFRRNQNNPRYVLAGVE